MTNRKTGKGIFGKKSMKQVSGAETLSGYIKVTAPSAWIGRIALVFLTGEVLAFSIIGAAEIHGDDSRVESVHSVTEETNINSTASITSDNTASNDINSTASIASDSTASNDINSTASIDNNSIDSNSNSTDSNKSDSKNTAAPMSYAVFKSLPPEQRKKVFAEMTGPEIYSLVKSSDENWPVTSYDLISPNNAKETIVLYDNNGNLHFNLAWPPYGGFLPESIASMGELSGTLDVSRDGGDSGHSMSYGRNADGTYPNDSQRSVPKSSATVRTGLLDVDRYLQVLNIVTNGETEDNRLSELRKLGYDSKTASQFLTDNAEFPSRDEISGPNNINDGAVSVGHTVEGKYGYYGITAPWVAGDLKLEGGAGQLCTVFSWGTLCASGLIHDTGTAKIN